LTPRHVAGALKEGIRIFRGFIVSFVISFVSSARLDFSRPEALGDLTQPLLLLKKRRYTNCPCNH
jgi:hypothetical protein